MKRTLVLAALMTASLSACAGGSAGLAKDGTLQSQPSPTQEVTQEPTQEATQEPTREATQEPTETTPTACPLAKDNRDLTKTPVYSLPKEAAPKTTTTKDIVVGTGPAAKEGDNLVAKYLGVNYETGEVFDASWKNGCDNTFEFAIGGDVIPGFSKGATGMKAGGRRLIVIPPDDGYGNQGPVPGGTIAFIIDVVKIN